MNFLVFWLQCFFCVTIDILIIIFLQQLYFTRKSEICFFFWKETEIKRIVLCNLFIIKEKSKLNYYLKNGKSHFVCQNRNVVSSVYWYNISFVWHCGWLTQSDNGNIADWSTYYVASTQDLVLKLKVDAFLIVNRLSERL